MSDNVEPQGRTRLFPGGFRNPFVRRDPLRRPDSNYDGHAMSVLSMFQGATQVSLHHSHIHMSPPGHSIQRSSQEPGGPPPTAGSSSPSTRAQTSPETPAIRSEIPTPSGAEPFPVPETSPEIYVHYLKGQGRGYPLWIPPPSMSLPVSYRSSGVRVGDVGIITSQGGFRFFFNVLHEATHSINAEMLLPDYFVPFALRGPSDVVVGKESSAMSHLSDVSITRIDSREDRLKAMFRTSSKQAAVLIMPKPVYHSELQCVDLFRQYVKKHLQGWYYFIRHELGRDVKNGDLRVIYSCRKSTGFGIATVSQSPHSITELTFSIDPPWVEDTDSRYWWYHTSGSAEVKAGPSLDENADIRDLDPNAGEPVNQCLFLSSLDFTLSDTQWAQLDSNNPVASLTQSSEQIMRPSKPGSPLAPSQSGTAPTSTSGVQRANSTAYGMGMNDQTQLPKRLFNPSDVLGRFLLDVIPDATCVAVCYDDWGPFITQDTNDAPSLMHGVLSANHVCWEDGMIYLIPDLIGKPSELLLVPCTQFMDLLVQRMNGEQVARYLDLDEALPQSQIPPYQREHHDKVLMPGSRAISDLPNIGIGVFDPYQHINNQSTILITIIDDNTIMTEIKPSGECPPAYVLMIDSIDIDHLNVDVDWFIPRTSDGRNSVFKPLMELYICVGLQLKEVLFVDTERTFSNKTAHEIFARTTTLASLAQILCQFALSSIGLAQTIEVVSHRLPSSLLLLGLQVMIEAPSEAVQDIPAQPLLPAPEQQSRSTQSLTPVKQSASTKQRIPPNTEAKYLSEHPTPDSRTAIRRRGVVLSLIERTGKLTTLPSLSRATSSVLNLAKIAPTVKYSEDGFQELVDDSINLVAVLYWVYQGGKNHGSWPKEEPIQDAARNVLRCLHSLEILCDKMIARSLIRRILYHPIDANTIEKLRRKLSSVTTQFQIATGLNVQDVLNQISKKNNELVSQLHMSENLK